MYEQGGIMTSEDGGLAVLAGATLGGGTRVNWCASFRTPQHVRQEKGLGGLPFCLYNSKSVACLASSCAVGARAEQLRFWAVALRDLFVLCRREWADECGLPDFGGARYEEALDAVCSRLGVRTGFKHRCGGGRPGWRVWGEGWRRQIGEEEGLRCCLRIAMCKLKGGGPV